MIQLYLKKDKTKCCRTLKDHDIITQLHVLCFFVSLYLSYAKVLAGFRSQGRSEAFSFVGGGCKAFLPDFQKFCLKFLTCMVQEYL